MANIPPITQGDPLQNSEPIEPLLGRFRMPEIVHQNTLDNIRENFLSYAKSIYDGPAEMIKDYENTNGLKGSFVCTAGLYPILCALFPGTLLAAFTPLAGIFGGGLVGHIAGRSEAEIIVALAIEGSGRENPTNREMSAALLKIAGCSNNEIEAHLRSFEVEKLRNQLDKETRTDEKVNICKYMCNQVLVDGQLATENKYAFKVLADITYFLKGSPEISSQSRNELFERLILLDSKSLISNEGLILHLNLPGISPDHQVQIAHILLNQVKDRNEALQAMEALNKLPATLLNQRDEANSSLHLRILELQSKYSI